MCPSILKAGRKLTNSIYETSIVTHSLYIYFFKIRTFSTSRYFYETSVVLAGGKVPRAYNGKPLSSRAWARPAIAWWRIRRKKKHTTSSFESTKALCVKGAAILSSAVSSLHLKIDRVNRGPANLRRHAPYCGCGFLTLVCWLFSYASLLFLCVNSFISERSMGSVLSRFDSIVFVRLFLMYRILIQFLTYVCDLILYVLEYWSFLLIW